MTRLNAGARRPGPLGGTAAGACRFEASVEPRPEELSRLRQAVAEWACARGLPECGEALLVLTELVANSMRHATAAPGAVRVEVAFNQKHLRIAVTDNCPHLLPERRPPRVDAESGRGLALLDALASTWDTAVHGGRKTVWAEVPLLPGHGAPSAGDIT